MSLDTVLDSNKKETEKKIRKLIFEDEEDPFNVNSIDVKSLERSTSIPSLESGLNNDSELKDAIQNNKVVRLIKEDGTIGVGIKTVFEVNKSSEIGMAPRVVSALHVMIPSKPPRQFWELVTPEMTPEVKRELEILSMRGYWDTKSFFKGDRKKRELPKEFELGRVVSGNFDSRRQRLTRREIKASLADELASDELFRSRSDKVIEKEKEKRSTPRRSKRRVH
ncbi:rRNA-processing protein FCF2-like protein [Blastocystis sp. subtype 4]|uniref:rRNA-processing protein FCF2-like protein n=1 Tax=Blastocystis sp. subtype 4 TaxID=944170 RepID=UPI000711D030|nr:rRNA-processing protein FCF2-like protein [Blastocystis sp. subtype 4]KNB43754.1 rRNA-processing protein FCF2-like protein [Blastocystis sp. subtype 4]|eukprot:XP_014527197.1 rRNA-processing protein FCF2-like protein [Blastocystis sp. subtype 4]